MHIPNRQINFQPKQKRALQVYICTLTRGLHRRRTVPQTNSNRPGDGTARFGYLGKREFTAQKNIKKSLTLHACRRQREKKKGQVKFPRGGRRFMLGVARTSRQVACCVAFARAVRCPVCELHQVSILATGRVKVHSPEGNSHSPGVANVLCRPGGLAGWTPTKIIHLGNSSTWIQTERMCSLQGKSWPLTAVRCPVRVFG